MPGIVETLRGLLTPKSDVERFEGWPEAQQAIADAQVLDPRAEGVAFYPDGVLRSGVNSARASLLGTGEIAGEHFAKLPGMNRIGLNQGAAERMKAQEGTTVRDLIAHELEHADQRKKSGFVQHFVNMLREPGGAKYGTGPLEKPAFEAEHAAAASRFKADRDHFLKNESGEVDPRILAWRDRMTTRGKK